MTSRARCSAALWAFSCASKSVCPPTRLVNALTSRFGSSAVTFTGGGMSARALAM